MNIKYDEGEMTSKNVRFEGETDDGRGFTIYANWNNWNDWSVDEISWCEEEGSSEEEQDKIIEEFLSKMN